MYYEFASEDGEIVDLPINEVVDPQIDEDDDFIDDDEDDEDEDDGQPDDLKEQSDFAQDDLPEDIVGDTEVER